MISVENALEHILTNIPSTSPERIQLVDAPGRRLAEPVYAPDDAPSFDNSAMDGYAVRFADIESVPTTLAIAGSSKTGAPAKESLAAGEAFHITTGARLPDGADTVVPRELCDRGGDSVEIREIPHGKRGAYVRRRGQYLQSGTPALEANTSLGGAEVGLIASFGRSVVTAYARPRVGVVSTGDELVELDEQPGEAQIVNSNAYMLEALVREQGAVPKVYPIAEDRREAIARTFRRAVADCDLVISSGGVSVGSDDHVGDVVDELSGGMTFWKVRMKPGKPLAFGVADRGARPVPLIGLPGNPASSFAGFHLFVRPALRVAQGEAPKTAPLPRLQATLRGRATGARTRRAYLAGTIDSTDRGLVFEPFEHQTSGNPALFATADAMGIVDADVDELADGTTIEIHVL